MQSDLGTNLTDIHRVIITTTLGVFVPVVRVLPCLLQVKEIQKSNHRNHERKQTGPFLFPHLWQRPIIPNISFIGKYVCNIAEFLLLGILFDWVQGFLCCNLDIKRHVYTMTLHILVFICSITHLRRSFFTSILAFDHRGASTTMLKSI